MKVRYMISIGVFFLICMMPITVFAVDFEVTDVKVDVYLTEEGYANVIEQHTYVFDSKFNGVTREIFPKSNASIVDFEAYENNTALLVEQEGALYKIYRSGKNETVDFELRYTIRNAVEKYEDGTQFYWTFFSEKNETSYGDTAIIVHPPVTTTPMGSLGYYAAYGTEKEVGDGVVAFFIGPLSAGERGDVRVVYPSSLFPAVVGNSGRVMDELSGDRQEIQEEKAAYLKTQNDMKVVGNYTIPAAFIGFIGLFSYIYGKRRNTKKLAQVEMDEQFVPREKLSMPGTIYYTMPLNLGPEFTSAALLDLIRQGYVKQVTETSFELIDATGAKDHEAALINLLFVKVGNGARFDFDALETYTKDKKNHKSYGEGLSRWRNGIVQEVKDAELYENRAGLRWLIGFGSLAFIPITIQLGRYELYGLMTVLILVSLIGLMTAVFYSPTSTRGMAIKEEWKQLRARMKTIETADWEKLPVDDKYRAYIYGIGVKDGYLQDLYEQFEGAEQRLKTDHTAYPVGYSPIYATQSFQAANKNASVGVDGSSTSSGSGMGGGGVGGSGGGSGAF